MLSPWECNGLKPVLLFRLLVVIGLFWLEGEIPCLISSPAPAIEPNIGAHCFLTLGPYEEQVYLTELSSCLLLKLATGEMCACGPPPGTCFLNTWSLVLYNDP